jgi:hypothetical protein
MRIAERVASYKLHIDERGKGKERKTPVDDSRYLTPPKTLLKALAKRWWLKVILSR